MRATYLAVTVAAVVGGLVGCDGGAVPAPPVYEVAGKVTVAGKPPTHAFVCFYPATPGDGREDFARIDGDGRYALSLPPGKYRVAIEPRSKFDPGFRAATNVPAKYQDTAKSGLTAEVTAAKDGLDFPLK